MSINSGFIDYIYIYIDFYLNNNIIYNNNTITKFLKISLYSLRIVNVGGVLVNSVNYLYTIACLIK